MSRRKDLSDTPRVKMWVEFCKRSLNVKSLYALERILEPGAFARENENEKIVYHQNKWRRYWRHGTVPRQQLIANVEKIVPGSSAILGDPCWRVFRALANDESFDAIQLFLLLPPGVIKQLFVFGGEHDGSWQRRLLTEKTIARLERRDDLAGIAALSVLIADAYQMKKGELALELGGALFYALLRLPFGRDRALAAVVPDLFDLLCKRVFPKACSPKRQLCMEKVKFQQVVELVGFLLESQPHGEKNHNPDRNVLDALFGAGRFTAIGFLTFAAPYQDLVPPKKKPKELSRVCEARIVECWDDAYAELKNTNLR